MHAWTQNHPPLLFFLPFQLPFCSYEHRNRGSKGINQHEAASLRSNYPSHSDSGGTYKHKTIDFNRASRPVGTSLSCCESFGHRVWRQSGPCSEGNSSHREPSPHLKRGVSHSGRESPSCSVAGVYKETKKRSLETEAAAVSSKRAKTKQHSDHASPSSVVLAESPRDDRLEENTCSCADHGGVSASQSGLRFSQGLEEENGQERVTSCTYTSFLPKKFYQWRTAAGGKEKVCITSVCVCVGGG